MSFDYPVALLALAFVPLSGLIYLAAQRRRRRFAVRFTNMDLLADVVTETPSWRRHIPPALFLLALAALLAEADAGAEALVDRAELLRVGGREELAARRVGDLLERLPVGRDLNRAEAADGVGHLDDRVLGAQRHRVDGNVQSLGLLRRASGRQASRALAI